MVEEGQTPPAPPPIGPWMDRDLWPWLFVLLLLVAGGIVAAVLLTRDDDKKTQPTTTVVASTPAQTVTVQRVTTTAPATTSATTSPAPVAGRVKVATVVGIPASAAVERLRDQGLNPVVRSVFSTKPRGTVAAQNPAAGKPVTKGSRVTLSVSKGQPAKPVPDVVGQSESEAASVLKAAGFDPDVQRVPSEEPTGTVVAQKPKAGEKQPGGTHVLLNVSAGPKSSSPPATTAPAATTPARTSTQPKTPAQPAAVSVPDLEGKTLQEARLAMRQAGLVTEIRYVPSDLPAGTVVAQAKEPGTTVKRGAHMLITVSQGSGPASSLVTVPDVAGQDEAAARSRLQQSGFAPAVECLATQDPAQEGTVVNEQPAAGTKAPKGSQILIYVGRTSCG